MVDVKSGASVAPELPDLELKLGESLEYIGRTHSMRNFDKLKSIFQDLSRDLISFVGAGVSAPLGILDWPHLIQKLLKDKRELFEDTYSDFITADTERDWTNVISKYSDEFPTIAERIKGVFSNNDEFTKRVISQMIPSSVKCTSVLIRLALGIKIHLTTNFDSSIETAYELISEIQNRTTSRTIPKVYYSRELLTLPIGDTPHIYYLHTNRERSRIILCDSEYHDFYKSDDVIARHLSTFFREFSVIFIGFSFSDKYVRDCITSAIRQAKIDIGKFGPKTEEGPQSDTSTSPQHFLITSKDNRVWNEKVNEARANDEPETEDSLSEFFEEYEENGIFPIVYKNHIYVDDLFKYLNLYRRPKSL